MNLRIFPPEEILQATIHLPLSKSESARALVMHRLSGSTSPLEHIADCDDTHAIALGLNATQGNVNVGAAGTAIRFLTAYYAATPGIDVVIDGSERMRQRPIATLVDALRKLGADIEYAAEQGHAPLHIRGGRLEGGELTIDASVSSQFVSALLMVAPLMTNGLTLKLEGEIASLPYLRMTVEMMRRRGIKVDFDVREGMVSVANGVYGEVVDGVTPDWSAASYWYEIAALTAGWVTLPGLSADSLQGDRKLADIAPRFGVLTDFDGEDGTELSSTPDLYSRLDLDMSDMPDLVQTVVVTAGLLGLPFNITGIQTLRGKETDRIAAIQAEMLKIGLIVENDGDKALSWDGSRCPIAELPQFNTYHDHRMAMAFAPVAVFIPGIVVRDAEVVNKSYPQFWDHLREAGFTVVDADAPFENPAEQYD